jgi:MOSC domain-containing protein YiiM
MAATVLSVNLSERKGTRKRPVDRASLVPDFGLQGDAHAGEWHRQVSLLARESIDKIAALGLTLAPGDFAENITTRGIDLMSLPVGSVLRVGRDAELEVTQIGKECHLGCDIRKQVGDCVMPREGIFARVTRPGAIAPGDPIEGPAAGERP